MNKLLLLVLCVFTLHSCKSKKEIGDNMFNYNENNGHYVDSYYSELIKTANCYDGLINNIQHDSSGPIKVEIQIDSIQFEDSMFYFDFFKQIELDKESELINVNEVFAFKLFHIEVEEYGGNFHNVRFDFFRDNGQCINRIMHSTHYTTLKLNNSMGESSSGYSGDKDYFKVFWKIKRVE